MSTHVRSLYVNCILWLYREPIFKTPEPISFRCRVKSCIFGQIAKFGRRPCLFHISNIAIKNKLIKQTVKILMRRLIRSRLIRIYTVCKCVSEFTGCPNLPPLYPIFQTFWYTIEHINSTEVSFRRKALMIYLSQNFKAIHFFLPIWVHCAVF